MAKNTGAAETPAQKSRTTDNGTGENAGCANAIHLSLQGKGGVGKSLIASILAQYLTARSKMIRCIDTDAVNRTLFQHKALSVSRLELLRDGTIDQRGFDTLMETLLTEDTTFVVDSGASTFIPLWSYILENSVVDVLTKAGKRLYVHTVITGGQALLDTLHGFKSLADSASDRNIIVWLNEYFGRIERDGKRFEETLSRRATEQLDLLAAQGTTDPEGTILRSTRKGCEWWTYAGLKANAALVQRFALPATFDSLTIRARCSAIELKRSLDAEPQERPP